MTIVSEAWLTCNYGACVTARGQFYITLEVSTCGLPHLVSTWFRAFSSSDNSTNSSIGDLRFVRKRCPRFWRSFLETPKGASVLLAWGYSGSSSVPVSEEEEFGEPLADI